MAFWRGNCRIKQCSFVVAYVIFATIVVGGCTEEKIVSVADGVSAAPAATPAFPAPPVSIVNGGSPIVSQNVKPPEVIRAVASPAVSPNRPRPEVVVVQSDVRKMVAAIYSGEVDTTISFTHPQILQSMGGQIQAKSALTNMFSQTKRLGLNLESMEFPVDPTFLKTPLHDFVIVPTLSRVVSAKGQRAESLNYQFGIRDTGSVSWKYMEGSRINQGNVRTYFPDFPTDFVFPQTYRRKL